MLVIRPLSACTLVLLIIGHTIVTNSIISYYRL